MLRPHIRRAIPPRPSQRDQVVERLRRPLLLSLLPRDLLRVELHQLAFRLLNLALLARILKPALRANRRGRVAAIALLALALLNLLLVIGFAFLFLPSLKRPVADVLREPVA